MTPANFEEKLNSIEEKIVTRLGQNSKVLNAFIFLIFVIILFLSRDFVLGIKIKFLNFPSVSSSYSTMVFLLFVATIIPFMRSSRRLKFGIIMFIIGTIYDINNSLWSEVSLEVYLSFFLMAVTSYLFLTIEPIKKFKYSAWIYVIFVGFFTYYLFKFCDGWQWFFLKKPMFYFAFVVSYIVSETLFTKRTMARMIFSPAHIILPINYPVESEELYGNEEYSVWLRGFIQIAKALALSCISYALLKSIPVLKVTASLSALVTYISYLLLAPAIANFVTGVAKIYMLNVPDCSNHTWLSGSPLDFLKRENVHAYQFSIRFFYFNFLKLTRNPIVIVLCYILVFPLFRDSLNYFTRREFLSWGAFYEYYSKGYAFWIVIFIAIVFTFRSSFFNRDINGWRAVGATHVVMYIVFYFFTLGFKMF